MRFRFAISVVILGALACMACASIDIDPASKYAPRLAAQTSTATTPTAVNPLASAFSFAEFDKGSEQATIVLYRLSGYSPFPALPAFGLELDSFAGVQSSSPAQGVGGFAGLGSWSFNKHWGAKGGLGALVDLSKQFQLNELALNRLGAIFAITYTP